MLYLFLLGRDEKLSKLEIATYFSLNKIVYKVIKSNEKYIIVDIEKKQNFDRIQKDLSGTTKIIELLLNSKTLDLNLIDKIDLYRGKKFNFTLSTIDLTLEERTEIEFYLKEKFKSERIKAVFKKPVSHSSKKSDVNFVANPQNFYSWKLDREGFEFFAIKVDDIYYYGLTLTCYDPKIIRLKDTKRPIIKEKYNTSFRVAGIMINLLGEKNTTIVDPFCGTGTFLIEGLIKGNNVVGIDLDSEMVSSSRKNLAWAEKTFKTKNNTYKIIKGDGGNTRFRAKHAVFEPYMGPFLRKIPTKERALKIVKELNEIYHNVFSNLNRNLGRNSKVVCILPQFKLFSGEKVNISRRVFLQNGFKILDVSELNEDLDLINPIPYTTPSGSRLNRFIYVLEKRPNIEKRTR